MQRRVDQLAVPYAEQNVCRDPEAAHLVLASGAPITLVPLDVTSKVRLRRGDLAARAGDPLGALLADQVDRYLGPYRQGLYVSEGSPRRRAARSSGARAHAAHARRRGDTGRADARPDRGHDGAKRATRALRLRWPWTSTHQSLNPG